MDRDFWLRLWQDNHIPFHEGVANDLLVRHFGSLSLSANARVLVPLCGKTRDIAWLLAQGHQVAGIDLSPLAVAQLFDELGVTPDITGPPGLRRHAAPGVVIWAGDLFDLTADELGPVDAVHDRAALIALPHDLRIRYAGHVTRITATAPQLVIAFEHDRTDWTGPPFSVTADEMARLYGDAYTLTLRDRIPVIRGRDHDPSAHDAVWLLR